MVFSCVYWPEDILTAFWFSAIKDQEYQIPHGQRFQTCTPLQSVLSSLQAGVGSVGNESAFHMRTLLGRQHDREKMLGNH